MKIIFQTIIKHAPIYKVEYWYLSFVDDDDMGYDYEQVEVTAISPKQAILKAKNIARIGAKNFTIVRK
tara:strand:+ start:379 stop:582 length:204 start_codon:yes stop_codon:yes gene_type:complete